jgi:hypothetical protein
MRAVTPRLLCWLMPLATLACGSRGEPLAVPETTNTVVSAYGAALAIEGRDDLSPARAFGVDEAVRVYLYPEDPEALFFGVVPEGLAPPGALSELIPATDAAFAWVPAAQAWVPLAVGDERPQVEARAVRCAAAGGCVLASGLCQRPCPPRPEPAAPIAPQPVAPPRFRPCPAEWREVELADGVEGCEAPALPLVPACSGPRRTRRVDGACVDVGAPCADASLRVPPGRGPAQVVAPGRLDAVLEASAEDAVLVLGGGEWTLSRPLLGRRLLLGRCAAETRVRGLVDARGDVGVSGLTLAGAPGDTTVAVASGARLALDGVVVEGSGAHAVRVDGGQLRARDAALRGGALATLALVGTSSVTLREVAVDGDAGAAVRSEAGAHFHVAEARLTAGAEAALISHDTTVVLDHVDVVHGGMTALHLTTSRLRAVGLRVTGGASTDGRAVFLEGATTATLSASAVIDVAGRAVHAEHSTLRLEDFWVHDAVDAVATVAVDLVLRRVRMDGLRGGPLHVVEGRLASEDLWLAYALTDPTRAAIRLDGSSALARTVVWASGEPSAIVALTKGGILHDLRLESPAGAGSSPPGLLQTQGSVRLERASFRGAFSAAISLSSASSSPDSFGAIEMSDVTVSATVGRNAVYVGPCNDVTLDRVSVEGRSQIAVALEAESRCTIARTVRDLRVRGAESLGLTATGQLQLQRLDIVGSAMRVRGSETIAAELPVRIALEDVRVDVGEGRMAAMTFAHRTARLTIDRFSLKGRIGVDLITEELLSFDEDPTLRVRLSEGRIIAGAAGLQLLRAAVRPGVLDELLSGVDVRTFLIVEP